MNKVYLKEEGDRQYIRLKSVFPIDFSIVRLQGDLPGINWQQGYTSNVSKGGLCLETSHLDESTIQFLSRENIFLDLRVHIPLKSPPVKVVAEVMWYKKENNQDPAKYMIGLKFHSIAPVDLKRILGHAQWLKFSAWAILAVSAVLFAGLITMTFFHYKLRLANEQLVANLVELQQSETETSQSLNEVVGEKEQLAKRLGDFTVEIERSEQTVEQLEKEIKQHTETKATNFEEQIRKRDEQIGKLQLRIKELAMEKQPLEIKYDALVQQENRILDNLTILERKKSGLKDTVVKKMELWLKNHQNAATGLVLSYEGHVGVINHWAFSYDQALAVNAFLEFSNSKAARNILQFFHSKITGDFNGFYNAYYYDSGDVAEYTVHTGPNTWVGIAAMQYTHRTQDATFLPLARKIADWLITIQAGDPGGGLSGGPRFSWFSTEHNLDAYAFFNMIYEKTKDERYRAARDKVLNWLKTYALVPHGQNYKTPPVNRGRGDATIATDTFAWSLAALGPAFLDELGMNPEQIMAFAEDHCGVDVQYERPSGVQVGVKGFDFSKNTNMPRGGLVSPEWTSQMIVSYSMLSDYFKNKNNTIKAGYYHEKAQSYLNELNKLIISSPSAKGQGEGCLPYATLPEVDTGHGWNTPSGAHTCSIAGTAYMILAIKNANPLMFK